ncbi:MAG: phage holin family protein [Muribaculaceae bacterium]|nr:phage holin family protein [Muribaculaceae bacterium]
MPQQEQTVNTVSTLWSTISTYLSLLIEDTRLSAAEKITRLLSGIAMCALMVILSTVALVFISIAGALGLASVLSPAWAFVIVAGVYLLIAALLLVFRTQLLVNPIARFISRIILPAPKKNESNDKSAPLPK